jgi:hypothetical protein
VVGVKLVEVTPLATVSTKPDHRGEHEGNRKTIARGMPGDSGVTVVTTTGEHLYPFLPTRLRAHRAPGIPCALYLEGKEFSSKTSGAASREIAKLYPRHCEERKRRSNPRFPCCAMDCFANARNDVDGAV